MDWDVPAFCLRMRFWPWKRARPRWSASGRSAGDLHQGFPNDPCFQYQWHLRQVGLPDAWKLGTGEGVIVAVIDTGVTQVRRPAPRPSFVAGYNFVANNANADDDHGHGTHVAGTIAQATNNKLGVAGVAYGAAIMPLKVLSAQRLGLDGRHRAGHPLRRRPRRQRHQHEPGRPLPGGHHRQRRQVRARQGRRRRRGGGQRRTRARRAIRRATPACIAVAATQFDETTTFYSNWGAEIDVAAPGGNTRVDQNGDGKPDGVLQNTIVPGNTTQDTTTSGSWAPRWPRRTSRAWPR